MTNEEIKYVVMLEIVCPEYPDDTLSDEERDEIYRLFKEHKPWNEVFSPIKDERLKRKYIEFFEKLGVD